MLSTAAIVYQKYDRVRDFNALIEIAEFVPEGSRLYERDGITIEYESNGRSAMFSDWTSLRIQLSRGDIPMIGPLFEKDSVREITLVTGMKYSDPLPILLKQSDLQQFATCNSLEALHLGGLTIDSLDISRVFGNLTRLVVDRCRVRGTIRVGIHPDLESLEYNEFGGSYPDDLAECLSGAHSLNRVSLNGEPQPEGVLDALAGIATLRDLTLSGWSVDGKWLQGLSCRQRLISLTLPDLSPDDHLAGFFSEAKQLRMFITDAGALRRESLRMLCESAPQIEILLFRSSHPHREADTLTDLEIAAIKKCTRLIALQLPRRAVTDEQIAELRLAFPSANVSFAE